VTVSIADRGPGMPSDVLEKVFEPFFTTKHRGTGLGMPIAKRVIEAHGGTIAIETPAAAARSSSSRFRSRNSAPGDFPPPAK